MQCPFCGSTHLQSYQVVRAQGTMRIEAEHAGMNGPYVVRTQGLAYSELARHCAPPAPPSPMGFVIATLVGGYVAYQGLKGFGFVYWPFIYIGLGIVGPPRVRIVVAPIETTIRGAAMKDESGKVRTGIQGSSGSAHAAAGERVG